MTLLSYQVFKTVVEQESFRQAADILNLTPSAVSHAITSLENELGFPVLRRGKNGVALTDYGKALLPYINGVLNSEESLQQAVAEFNGLKKGRVKVGCFSSICTGWLPDVMRYFQENYPEITIEVFQGTYDDVTYWIKNGMIDVGFLSVSGAKDVPVEPLCKDRLLCVVPKGMKRKSQSKYMDIEELKSHRFVTQRESTDADIQKFLKENSLTVQSDYHVVDDLSMVAMVECGLGICLMPALVMNHMPYQVECYPVFPEAYRIIGLAAFHPEFMTPAARIFYHYVLEEYQEKEFKNKEKH